MRIQADNGANRRSSACSPTTTCAIASQNTLRRGFIGTRGDSVEAMATALQRFAWTRSSQASESVFVG
jgi:hypothetical protein